LKTMAVPVKPGKRTLAPPSILEAALQCAARGWPVLPLHTPTAQKCSCRDSECSSPGKHPRVDRGLKEASADADTIRRWWKKWPDANIGIATGPASGLFVVDVDGTEGHASLADLQRGHALPGTLRALTGRTAADGKRQGFHLYFTYPDGERLTNSAGKLGKGLDIRASGGYVVAPPSLHASGLRYEWEDALSPVAVLPGWLHGLLAKPAPRLAIVPSPATSVSIFEEGSRNSSLFSLGGKMRADGHSTAAIAAALLQVNGERCRPPLSEDEVRAIAASFERYAPGHARPKAANRANLLCLANVQAEAVQWLWEPYIPLKMLTILGRERRSWPSILLRR
jgi:hypothetical protein